MHVFFIPNYIKERVLSTTCKNNFVVTLLTLNLTINKASLILLKY